MEQPSLFASLFDFSFKHLVAPRLAKLLYSIGVIVFVLIYLVLAYSSLHSGSSDNTTTFNNGFGGTGTETTSTGFGPGKTFGVIWVFVLGPLTFFLYTALYRIFFEMAVMIYDIHQRLTGPGMPAFGGGPAPATPPAQRYAAPPMAPPPASPPPPMQQPVVQQQAVRPPAAPPPPGPPPQQAPPQVPPQAPPQAPPPPQ